jgi:ribosome-associated heat shock protein Hsp15
MTVRIDKWLKVARIFKTRTKATAACTSGKVRVNSVTAKPHHSVLPDDQIEVRFGDWTRILIVKRIADKPVPKAVAREFYEDRSSPRPRLDPIDRILLKGGESRERGKGRPTKKERRSINHLKGK